MRQWIREYRVTIKRRKLLREMRTLATLGDCAQSRRRAVVRELQEGIGVA